jgi:hypothetical protein
MKTNEIESREKEIKKFPLRSHAFKLIAKYLNNDRNIKFTIGLHKWCLLFNSK